ncbi:MAG: mechanosensitive ion channel family protein [Verrucomicrobiota bacterium]
MRRLVLFALLLVLPFFAVQAEEGGGTNGTAMVMFHGQELFEITSISSVSADSRVEILVKRFKKLAKSPLVSTKKFTVHDDDNLKISAIMSGTDMVCAVWKSDAELHAVPREKLAEHWRDSIADIIDQYRKDYTTESYMKGAAFAAVTTIAFLIILWLVCKLCKKEMKLVEEKFAGQQMFKFLDGDSIITVNGYLMKLVRFVVIAVAFIIYLDIVLSLFPWTFNMSARLFELISSPLVKFGHGFVDNLPNLFSLLVIWIIVSFILRTIKHIFTQIGEGKVRIKGFYQDWADTTYGLIRMVIIVFAAVVAFPYIPGSSSPAFKGISIFMGVLVSLGSSSAVGNIFGSLMLTYMRAFAPGDFVEINGQRGTVMARRTFSTRLKTPTNEIISIPNASVSANHIINFSRMTKSLGVNIGTAVTIGYDVPWRTVHELLLKSAEGVPDVLEDPAPTILQLALDDFYVKYKLVISTKNPAGQFRILSNIHQNIQDNFAEAGVEIMSPHFQANRVGEEVAIPPSENVKIPNKAKGE